MANAPEIMQAITALLSGLTQNIQTSRAQQLQGLSMLAQQPGYSLEPATNPQPVNFLRQLIGQADYAPNPATGAPVVRYGNIPMTAGRTPTLEQALPGLFTGESGLPEAIRKIFAGQYATPGTREALTRSYLGNIDRQEDRATRRLERDEDYAARTIDQMRDRTFRTEDREDTQAFRSQESAEDRKFRLEESSKDRTARAADRAAARQLEASRRREADAKTEANAVFTLRKSIADAYRAAGQKVPKELQDPSLSREALMQAYSEAPEKVSTARGKDEDAILRDIASVEANITKQLEGGEDVLTGLLMKKLGELDRNTPERRQREATVRTYRQRGLVLAKKLRDIPGMGEVADAYIADFSAALEPPAPDATPQEALPLEEPKPAEGFKWPWQRMGETGTLGGGTPKAKIKSFRQLED